MPVFAQFKNNIQLQKLYLVVMKPLEKKYKEKVSSPKLTKKSQVCSFCSVSYLHLVLVLSVQMQSKRQMGKKNILSSLSLYH